MQLFRGNNDVSREIFYYLKAILGNDYRDSVCNCIYSLLQSSPGSKRQFYINGIGVHRV
jgi:hypothetical protein